MCRTLTRTPPVLSKSNEATFLIYEHNIFSRNFEKNFEKIDTAYQVDPHDFRVTKWGLTLKSAHRVQTYEFIKIPQKFTMLCASLFTFLQSKMFKDMMENEDNIEIPSRAIGKHKMIE